MVCTIDFWRLDEGFGGKTYKHKREEAAAHDTAMDVEMEPPPPSKRSTVASSEDPDKPVAFGRPTYDGVIVGRVLGRNLKQVRMQRSSAIRVSMKGKSFEERKREKEVKTAFRDRMTELKDEICLNKHRKLLKVISDDIVNKSGKK